jgi:glycosyltransferase involved in cell wall biosynthesis
VGRTEGAAAAVRIPVKTTTRTRPVALFLPSLVGGGAERVFLDIASGLAGRGLPVDLVIAKTEGALLDQVPGGVRLRALHARRTASSVPALVRYLRRERPAALLTALAHANLMAVAAATVARTGTRVVVTEHLPPSTWVDTPRRRDSKLMPRMMHLGYPRAGAVVAVSSGVADDLARRARIPRSTVRVIYNPILVDRLAELAAEPLDHPWFAPGMPPVVLAVGRLTAQKDFGTLIRAVAAVRERRPCRLLVLGEGEERPRLEALVADLDLGEDVSLPGFVPNPYPYFRAASMLALSSRFEGLPTVLLEAMCLGVPVVATDCPSGPSEILDGGRHGRLVPVGDAAALAAAIGETLERPIAPERDATARYELDSVIDAYIDALGLDHAPTRH